MLSVMDIDRVHFVGLSTGGAIGQLFAATYPEMTRTLTLCDTSSYVPSEVWDSRIANARERYRRRRRCKYGAVVHAGILPP